MFLYFEKGSVLVFSPDSIWSGFVYTLHVAHCIVRLLGRVNFIGRDSVRVGLSVIYTLCFDLLCLKQVLYIVIIKIGLAVWFVGVPWHCCGYCVIGADCYCNKKLMVD